LASYLLRVKSKLGSDRIRAHLYTIYMKPNLRRKIQWRKVGKNLFFKTLEYLSTFFAFLKVNIEFIKEMMWESGWSWRNISNNIYHVDFFWYNNHRLSSFTYKLFPLKAFPYPFQANTLYIRWMLFWYVGIKIIRKLNYSWKHYK